MRVITSEEVLFKKHYKSLCHYAWQMVHDMRTAEDLVQDAFVTYFRKKDEVSQDDVAIKNFLYTTVKFSCYNLSRREKVDAKYIDHFSYTTEWYDSELELQIMRSEVLAEIYNIVETMPESCKLIFRKGYIEGLTTKEIAEELGISLSTVKTQKSRALKIILNKLNPEYFTLFILLFR